TSGTAKADDLTLDVRCCSTLAPFTRPLVLVDAQAHPVEHEARPALGDRLVELAAARNRRLGEGVAEQVHTIEAAPQPPGHLPGPAGDRLGVRARLGPPADAQLGRQHPLLAGVVAEGL